MITTNRAGARLFPRGKDSLRNMRNESKPGSDALSRTQKVALLSWGRACFVIYLGGFIGKFGETHMTNSTVTSL